MRDCIVKIDNSGKVTVTQPTEYIEEHGATQLVITLNNELKTNGVTYYTLCFKPGAALKNPPDVKITSDMISVSQLSNGTICYPLPSELTCFGSLDVQVQAHVIDNSGLMTSLIKSPVFRLYFEPSITGDEEILIGEGEGFISLIHSALAQLNLTVEEVEELCDKIAEAFENGELNGPVIMPSVSEDGTLSWSNDAGLENPPPVNIKGPKGDQGEKGEKGDKGDKGEKGDTGRISEEEVKEIAANTAARHTHGNKELLDSLTESMIGTLDVYHELPEVANDGDICIYSPANVPTVEDSGKLIYVDWDVFNKTFAQEEISEFVITFYDANEEEVGFFYATNTGIGTAFQYIRGDEQWDIQFADGIFDAASSSYTDGETTVMLDKAPESFTLPYFSSYKTDNYNIGGDVFYAPIKLMVYRGGWYEYTSASTVDISIYHGHTLPENAKEGDLCLYAKPNTLTLADSGKKIYIDWNEFSKPISETAYVDAFLFQANKTDGDTNFSINLNRTEYDCNCLIEDSSTGFMLNVGFNGGVLGHATLGDTEYNSIEEIPTYIQLPYFDTLNSNIDDNAYLFHTEYKLMKYQGGEWSEVSDNSRALIDRIESAGTTLRIQPNIDYVFGNRETLTITFADGKENKRNEYMFSFTSGATPTVLTLPDTVKWVNELTIEANKRYEVSIIDNVGLWCAVEVSI